MLKESKHAQQSAESQAKLIAAAQGLMVRQGYAATTVDQVCAEAGLTKGSFFHHYASKESLCRAAVDAWGEMGTRMYAQAWSDPSMDPLDQLYYMLDIMISFTTTRDEPCVCMVGMMSQELSATNPDLRAICAGHLNDWTQHVVRLLRAAKLRHRPTVNFDPERVAWLLNSIWQGSMLIAKTCQTPEMIVSNLALIRACLAALFAKSLCKSPTKSSSQTSRQTSSPATVKNKRGRIAAKRTKRRTPQ